jgi:uncharacterized protein
LIIDCHIHIGAKYGWKFTPDMALRLMDEAGIDMAMPTGLAEVPGEDTNEVEEMNGMLEKYPKRFPFGFLRMNPWFAEKAVKLFHESVESTNGRIKGIKFHPVSAPIWPSHPYAVSLWKAAAEHDAPIYIHSGTDMLSLPLQIGAAAKAAPEATFIMGHFGYHFYYEDAIKMARKYENIYLETSALQYPEQVRKAADLVGADRIVYGSDLPPLNPVVEIKKLNYAGLTPREKDLILWKNTAKMMGIKA